MKVYILTENDVALLNVKMEKWEAEVRGKYSQGHSESGTPEGDTLRKVRYSLVEWIQAVTR